MNKYITLIFLCLLQFSCSAIYYRPMSNKTIDFGEDVCHYVDISDNSQLAYVKGCPEGKSCQSVESDSSDYQVHTCQPFYSNLKRKNGENCDANLYECYSNNCQSGKCSDVSSGSTTCTTIGKSINDGTENCITTQADINVIGKICLSQETSTSQIITYTHYSSSGKCSKLTLEETGSNTKIYYIKQKELVDGLFSLKDGDYFDMSLDELYCESGFYLYFYGNGKQAGVDTSETTLYKRCVTPLAIEKIWGSSSYIIKYKIGNEEHIYDTSKIQILSHLNQKNDLEDKYHLLMTRLELFNKMKEEYKANGPNTNDYTKWNYLFYNPEKYILYKDQTEVLDYLIQKDAPNYKPEGLKDNTPIVDNTDQATDNETETEEPSNQSRFLNIRYYIILLSLFIL